jgi:hypothetical protein
VKGVDVRRTLCALLISVGIWLLRPQSVASQVFYQYPDAAVIKPGEFVAGPSLALGDHQLFRLGAFGRMNATKYLDVGADLLFDSADGDERFGAAGDVKFALFPETNAIPFDLSITVGLGVIGSDHIKIVQVPLGGILSSPFRLDSGRLLVPYLGVYVLYIDTDIKQGAGPDISDSEVDVEIRTGLSYTLSASSDLFVGLHLGRDALVTIGATFWLRRGDAN